MKILTALAGRPILPFNKVFAYEAIHFDCACSWFSMNPQIDYDARHWNFDEHLHQFSIEIISMDGYFFINMQIWICHVHTACKSLRIERPKKLTFAISNIDANKNSLKPINIHRKLKWRFVFSFSFLWLVVVSMLWAISIYFHRKLSSSSAAVTNLNTHGQINGSYLLR